MAGRKGQHPMCQKPDRHVPKLTCGYPLPCPYHTVIVDGKKLLGGPLKKKKHRLTETQLKILTNISEGLDSTVGCHGRSSHGGWSNSYFSLVHRGLISAGELTKAGIEALEKHRNL